METWQRLRTNATRGEQNRWNAEVFVKPYLWRRHLNVRIRRRPDRPRRSCFASSSSPGSDFESTEGVCSIGLGDETRALSNPSASGTLPFSVLKKLSNDELNFVDGLNCAGALPIERRFLFPCTPNNCANSNWLMHFKICHEGLVTGEAIERVVSLTSYHASPR